MKNKYIIDGLITTIQSTGKHSDMFFTVDTTSLPKIEKFTWRVYKMKNGYLIVESGIFRAGKKISFTLNRFLLDYPINKIVDHIDRNPLNNILSNLRIVDNMANSQNASKHSTKTTSIYKGVCFHKSKKLLFAYINHNKKRYNLGYFKNENDAAFAYNNKIKELKSDFCCPNVIL